MRRFVAFLMLGAAGCVAPARVITLPSNGIGAFSYNIPPLGRGSRHDIIVAVVRPKTEHRSGDSGSWGGSGSGRAVMDAGLARSGVPGAGALGGAAASAKKRATLKTEAEVDDKISELFDLFQDAARRDLDLIIRAKGLRSAGSFRATTDMTFSEKRETTLVLVGEYRITIAKAVEGTPTILTPVNGTVVVEAECDYYLVEPLSGEKFWSRRIELTEQEVPYTVSESQNWQLQLSLEDGRPAAVGKALQAIYKESLDRLWSAMETDHWTDFEGDALALKRRAAPVMR